MAGVHSPIQSVRGLVLLNRPLTNFVLEAQIVGHSPKRHNVFNEWLYRMNVATHFCIIQSRPYERDLVISPNSPCLLYA